MFGISALCYSEAMNRKLVGKLQSGFTIVELLIVIVVIGILAAITIVAFNGIQNRANDTAIQSDLSNIAKKLDVYKLNSTDDRYPVDLLATGLDIKVSRGAYGNHYTTVNGDHNLLYCLDNYTNRTAFAVIARSKSGTTYAVRNTTQVRPITLALTTANDSCPDQGMVNTGAWWGHYQSNWRSSL